MWQGSIHGNVNKRRKKKKHEEFETNSKKHNNTPKHEKSLIRCNPQHKTIRKH